MKIRIKEFRGTPVCRGFFPRAGLRVKPQEVYECESEDEFQACMATDQVEAVPDETPVTERLVERRNVLDGEVKRKRDVVQEALRAENEAQMSEMAAANEQLSKTVQELTDRLAALESRKPGRPRKNAVETG